MELLEWIIRKQSYLVLTSLSSFFGFTDFYCQPCQGELCVMWFFCLLSLVMCQHLFFRGFVMPFCCCFCCVSEVIVCLFSFSFLYYVQIKGTKIIFWVLQLVRSSPGRVSPDRKQFNLAIDEGHCRVETSVQVCGFQSLRLLLLGVKHQKPYYTEAKEEFFAKDCVLPQKHTSLELQLTSCHSNMFDLVK